jgi:hypothetical protein
MIFHAVLALVFTTNMNMSLKQISLQISYLISVILLNISLNIYHTENYNKLGEGPSWGLTVPGKMNFSQRPPDRRTLSDIIFASFVPCWTRARTVDPSM